MRERTTLEASMEACRALESGADENSELIELAEAEGDEEMIGEAISALEALAKQAEQARLQSLLSGEADGNDCYLEVHAGAGGTDAADWADILLRMYTRWADKQGYSVELIDRSEAEEAGIRSAALAIRGDYAFGYMQAESGVHRLVRISPFDQNNRRQTAFAAVAAYPEIDDSIEIDLKEADIEMKTMRASGAGGQHVNTTDSAVRLKHIPTGIDVVCRAERSQHKNRETAMKMLRAKLYQRELDKRLEAQAEINAQKKKIDFGSQIRSYVMQPYQQVKDLRTGETVGDVDGVLGGNLNNFMEAWLAARAEGTLGAGE